VFAEPLPSNDSGRFKQSHTIRIIQKTTPPTILLFLRVFVAGGGGGYVSTKQFPSNDVRDKHTDTKIDERD
jgi:hypothetical protein